MEEFMLPWKYEFNEMGGYDCMSDSFDIIDSVGDCIITIDLNCLGELEGQEAKEHGEKLAKFIVDKCNDVSKQEGVQE